MKALFKIKRYQPDRNPKPYWETFEVELEPTDRVVDGLNYIRWYLDGTLSFRRSCVHGVCGSDAMIINGRNRLACKVLMKDVGSHVTIEPLRGFRVLKDLVVDMEPFFEKMKAIRPYLVTSQPAPDRERLQDPEDRERFDDTTKCILCASCTTSCPSFWANGDFLGPAAVVQAHRFIFDSRDEGTEERLNILSSKFGVWRCRTVFNCFEACPREIDVTRAIEQIKRLIIQTKL